MKRSFMIWDLNLIGLLLCQLALWATNSEVLDSDSAMKWATVNHVFFVLDFMLYSGISLSFYEYLISLIREIQGYDQKKYRANRFFLIVWLLISSAIYTISLWTGTLYVIRDGFAYYTPAYDFFVLFLAIGPAMNMAILFEHRKLLGNRKATILNAYLVLPLLFTFFIDLDSNLSVSYVLYAFVAMAIYIEVDIEQGKELIRKEAEIAKHEMEMTNMRVDLMMSQIQPHFLYNALSSIAYLCSENPKEAEVATNEFASYLKINLRSIDSKEPIPFSMELNHVENYLKIQRRRFIDRMYVEYDITAQDFLIPALTMQTIVENSVKHAVQMRFEPTTITISTLETDEEYVVIIKDDGPGFDLNQPPKTDRLHIGVDSTKRRLADMVGGKLTIYSTIGEGTKNIITIPKDKGGHSE